MKKNFNLYVRKKDKLDRLNILYLSLEEVIATLEELFKKNTWLNNNYGDYEFITLVDTYKDIRPLKQIFEEDEITFEKAKQILKLLKKGK